MRIAVSAVCLLLVSCAAWAEDQPVPKPVGVYRVDFALHEFEQAKRVGTHNYSLLLQDSGYGKIRMGTKVPVTNGNATQYIDIGLTLDCHLHERESQVALDIDIETSSMEAGQQAGPQMIRQVKASSVAAVTPGKPTTVIAMDDITAKRRYEVEVTATKVP